VNLAFAHARSETTQLLRIPAYWVSTIAFPIVMLLLFGRRSSDDGPERLLAGFAAMAVLGVAFFQFGLGVAADRMFQWETYLRTLPAGAGTRLFARLLSALCFTAFTVAAVGLVASLAFDASIPVWRWVLLVTGLLLGGIPFALLGVTLGYWLPPRAALPVANLVFLPLAIGGSLWARPSADIPREADVASQLLPTRSWIEILDPIATGDGSIPPHHVAALASWTALFGALAWWGFRRDEGERFR